MIRNFKMEDLSAVCRIAKQAWAPIFQGYDDQLGAEVYAVLNPDSRNSKDRQLTVHAERHPDCFFVAERHGRVVGFITFECDYTLRIGTIGNNAVDPECGEKGVGQEMYQAVLERFRNDGMRLARVTTGLDAAHAPARRAYERAGFRLHTEAVTYVLPL